MPNLLVTAGNDQNLRIWDVRHLPRYSPSPTEDIKPSPRTRKSLPSPPPSAKPDGGMSNTIPDTTIPYEEVETFANGAKGKGLMRASFKHGKSCSAAYWDPWGRRILTTSYDDKLRSECYARSVPCSARGKGSMMKKFCQTLVLAKSLAALFQCLSGP
jgi:hypothetical protein